LELLGGEDDGLHGQGSVLEKLQDEADALKGREVRATTKRSRSDLRSAVPRAWEPKR
jgi:hypothetical protein